MRSILTIALGLLALLVMLFLCVTMNGPKIQNDLTARSVAELRAAGLGDLAVVADGRHLTVSGVVSSEADETRALALVAGTYGVVEALDAITVDAGPTLAECRLLAKPVGESLSMSGVAPARSTVAAIRGGTRRALATDDVVVAKLAPHAGMGAGLAAALPWLHRLNTSEAQATAKEVVIRGTTNRPALAEAALLSLVEAAPEGFGSRVEIEPGRVFAPEELWAMVRPRGQGALLSGIVASAAQRDAIVGGAEELFEGPVHNAILVANVEGADLAPGMAAGIPIVQTLANGRLSVSPLKFFLTGLTPEGAPFDMSQLKALRNVMPTGAELVSDVTTPLTRESCQQDLNHQLSEEKIQFETAKADIKPASDPLLVAVASTLRRCPGSHLTVEGHTDDQGQDRFNLDLSNRRSGQVYDRLIELGMPATRASAEGYGESRPIGDNQTEEGRAQNRRIEFRLEEIAR